MNKPWFTIAMATLCGLAAGFLLCLNCGKYLFREAWVYSSGPNKVNDLMYMIDQMYVDKMDPDSILDAAMPSILDELDPHSVYFSADEARLAEEDLQGSFCGIGITYAILRDTIHIIRLNATGPAEKVGLHQGDRIVRIDTTSLVGLDESQVVQHLRGEEGTALILGVMSRGDTLLRWYNLTRDEIMVNSIEAAYMVDAETGYVRVEKFTEGVYGEMLTVLTELSKRGMKSLILDLRGNTGGYMTAALKMANEFLEKGQHIVYTEGRASSRDDFWADGSGSFRSLPLVVLIDEYSASSSEILAGAIQDNDRGTLIGRRSFGKGLIQVPLQFADSSTVRLTIARYHTPSGRCIQKPYHKGYDEDYEMDIAKRYERGEFFFADSIRLTGPSYTTLHGRTVYGGGGIMPDIFIPEDTLQLTAYYREAFSRDLLYKYSIEFIDRHLPQLQACRTLSELVPYIQSQNVLEDFVRYADKRGLRRRNLVINQSRNYLGRAIVSHIIANVKSVEDYWKFMNQTDPAVQRALEVIRQGKTVPRQTNQIEPII